MVVVHRLRISGGIGLVATTKAGAESAKPSRPTGPSEHKVVILPHERHARVESEPGFGPIVSAT